MTEETDNTLKTRTVGAIAMGPKQNLQGRVLFCNLNSGRKLDRNTVDYTILPMPDEVIKQVNQLGNRTADNGGVVFTNCDAKPIGEELDDELEYHPNEESESNDDEVLDDDVITPDELNQLVEEVEQDSDSDNDIEITGVDQDDIRNIGVDLGEANTVEVETIEVED